MDPLERLGWTPALAAALPAGANGLVPGRVVRQTRIDWDVVTSDGEVTADLRGRFRKSVNTLDLPAVGDWVLLSMRSDERTGTIELVLPRRTALLRKAAGDVTQAQVVAANVDTVLVTVPLDIAVNPRRIERALAVVWESGATPVVVATKTDLVGDLDTALDQLRAVAAGVDIAVVSAQTGQGIEALDPWLRPTTTLALLGPSGAGKSTLANRLAAADVMATSHVRGSDRKGRHTTSHRELMLLPSGALLIDTPGLRELALWDANEGMRAAFADVDELTGQCRFANCAHRNDAGCAVAAAVASGELAAERAESWHRLQAELVHLAERQDALVAAQDHKKWASITREAKRRARP